MIDENYEDFLVNVTPLSIKFTKVEKMNIDLDVLPAFKGMVPCYPDTKTAKDYLYKKASQELAKFSIMGALTTGDYVRVRQNVKGTYLHLEVAIIEQSKTFTIEELFKNTPLIVQNKKEEIRMIHDKINSLLDCERYDLAEQLVEKINYIRNEFMF